MPRIALFQSTTGIDPGRSADDLSNAALKARGEGAEVLFTPEMSGFLDRNRERAAQTIRRESEDIVLAASREIAARDSLWIALGSLAIDRGDGRWANRSYIIDPAGQIRARYDKMHMFDVDLASGESWRESSAYAPGEEVITLDNTPLGRLGLAICYDLRFPALFEALGSVKCDALAIPASFTVPTGKAHWHVLQRARAIEASAFVIAAAQVGSHEDGRETFGHSLVIDPWGEVLLDMGGHEAGIGFADIDLSRIAEVRAQVPSLANRRAMGT